MSAWLEAAFATHRPRAIAVLAQRFRDVDLAEDAFADACLKALVEWPAAGAAPRDPLAWLLTVARNAALDRLRRSARRERLLAEWKDPDIIDHQKGWDTPDPATLGDDVLRLLFLCCHPALSRQDQLALALKVVAGLTVDQVARAFLVRPEAMEQRLTRAKRAIAANPVPFDPPSADERAARLGEVSLMIYLMFNEGWSTSACTEQTRPALTVEAIRLARLLADLFPAEAELQALLALLLFQEARQAGRVDGTGNLLTLDEQDRSRWDGKLIAEAAALMQKVNRHPTPGVFRIQAAIAGAHARAASAEATDWRQIEAHYEALYRLQPTPIVHLNLIAARARTRGPREALDQMQPLSDALSGYRWFHTMRAAYLRDTGAQAEAIDALRMALDLGPTDPERAAIERDIAACQTT